MPAFFRADQEQFQCQNCIDIQKQTEYQKRDSFIPVSPQMLVKSKSGARGASGIDPL